ncbi:hypothetical protein [Streptomyces caatingaensis]|uniref:Lipoprotein n=1 Tax=Streptomyces caatingaensis TaxID=1678637 RepID=A0A0K9XE23_9ACTN|nr:hypothetical protein [Streptomyces caatingaensis]KNB51635.1 hypothetical protein AC230_14905 [Streptomyces caatingaensis]
MSRRRTTARTTARTTLRIALASAAVAGAVLAPVSSAFAAPRTPAVAVAAADESGPVRTYKLPDGSRASVHETKDGHFQVAVSKGDVMLAVLDGKRPYATVHDLFVEMDVRNGRVTWVEQKNIGLGKDGGNRFTRGKYIGNKALPGGIRAVVYQRAQHEFTAYVVWNGKLVKVLDRTHPAVVTGKYAGYEVRLDARTGKVVALKDKGSSGQGRTTREACAVVKQQDIGAGTLAVMVNSPDGPEVSLEDMGDRSLVLGHLDRKHPSLPKSAGIIAKITDIDTAQPKLVTKVEGGLHTYATTLFPKLPKGCTVVNHVK